MSASSFNLMPPSPVTPSHRWGWFMGLGILQVIIGVLCWIDVAAASIAATVVIGALLLLGGMLQVIQAFTVRGWSGFMLHVLMGVFYVVGGLLLMDEPIRGSLIITIVISVLLIVSGVARLVMAATHRHMPGLWLVVVSGVVSFVIGVLLYASLPWSSLWVLGTLIAIELVFHGVAWIQFGLALKKLHQPV
ncbi:HdeD family acid-resistance protein [Acidisoma sp.]|uniref:HdeD family acid-resistance protein n=1 Tax=Acidisoma sp. TaxID=1872115 RepID=UPI003AFFC5EB